MKTLITASVVLLMCMAAMAADPCCAIKTVDVQSGIVTAADNHSGATFRFQVSSADARNLKPGQAVTADFQNKSVAVAGMSAHFSIVLSPIAPCCSVVSVDLAHGLAAARINESGKTFQVIFDPNQPPDALKAGQAFDANFQSNLASLGGRNFRLMTAAGAAQVFPSSPCCSVKAIDAKARMLTVMDNASGRTFQVRVTNPAAMSGIKVGAKLYGNGGLNIFSVDHLSPCCAVMP